MLAVAGFGGATMLRIRSGSTRRAAVITVHVRNNSTSTHTRPLGINYMHYMQLQCAQLRLPVGLDTPHPLWVFCHNSTANMVSRKNRSFPFHCKTFTAKNHSAHSLHSPICTLSFQSSLLYLYLCAAINLILGFSFIRINHVFI